MLVLAGGSGTRLKPLTDYLPKIMMSIHGQPFLHYLIKEYSKFDIVLSVNYKKEAIKNWCRQTKNYLEFVDEPEFVSTGGAIRVARPFLEGKRKFIVINGDTYFNVDFEKIFKAHDWRKEVCTVVHARSILDNTVRNAGIYVFSQEIFNYIQRPKKFVLEDKLSEIPHKVYESEGTYLDIGTHEGLRYAKENLFLK